MARLTITKNVIHKELDLLRGDKIVVEIDKAANVILLNDTNLNNFTSARSFRHHGGGYFTSSPVVLVCPSNGHWNLVIDLPNGGRIKYSISVLRN